MSEAAETMSEVNRNLAAVVEADTTARGGVFKSTVCSIKALVNRHLLGSSISSFRNRCDDTFTSEARRVCEGLSELVGRSRLTVLTSGS